MSDRTKTLSFGNLKIELDKNQVFPDDPGDGAPAMVTFGDYCASITCAICEGELTSHKRGFTLSLSEEQIEWLSNQEDEVNRFLYE